MNGLVVVTFGVVACLSGAVSGGCALALAGKRAGRARRREAAFGQQIARARRLAPSTASWPWAMRYAEALTRRLFTGAVEPLAPSVRMKRTGKTRAGAAYLRLSVLAGCAADVSVSAYCEARMRLAVAGACVGALVGALISAEMAVVLGCAGGVLGRSLPGRGVRSLVRSRGLCAERHLSEMLEVVSLGLRSGLTFDRSFELYGSHFENEFAVSCAKAYRRWSLGLSTRDDALRDLAASYDCAQLSRVVDGVMRNLRFGTSFTDFLEEAAAQSRATYRAALEERVAKAPVKMMLPTGTLILPAMLLLVMGPVLLELAGGF